MDGTIRWNTPLQIPLDPALQTIVGRVVPAVSSSVKCQFVLLHSELLPYMLSEQHASMTFDPRLKKWMIEDLKVWSIV